jgi:hypothetical protein
MSYPPSDGLGLAKMAVVTVVDLASLRPSAADLELVADDLIEVGCATAAELVADLKLPLPTVAAVLRRLLGPGLGRGASPRAVAAIVVDSHTASR